MKIAVIPARGGSKRIPRKNICLFNGQPMISWSIKAALDSGIFDRVIVSTDDKEIATIAQNYGAEVPFIRPDALSNDYTGTIPVIAHAIETIQYAASANISQVCCLYATAPFVCAEDIVNAYQLLNNQNVDYVFAITKYPFPIQRALRVDDVSCVSMLNPEHFSTRSQDLEEMYHDAGQFYWGTKDSWLQQKPIFNSRALGYYLPKHRVQDIDDQEDWQRAELMHKALFVGKS